MDADSPSSSPPALVDDNTPNSTPAQEAAVEPSSTGNLPLSPNANPPALPTGTGSTDSSFGTSHNVNTPSTEHTGNPGPTIAVYAGITVAAVLALVLFTLMGVRMARNRRLRHEEKSTATDRHNNPKDKAVSINNSVSSSRSLENGTVVTASRPLSSSGLPPVTETRNLGISFTDGVNQSPKIDDNLFFDADLHMQSAGLGVTPPVFGLLAAQSSSGYATPTNGNRGRLVSAPTLPDFEHYKTIIDPVRHSDVRAIVPDDILEESIYNDNYMQMSQPPQPNTVPEFMLSAANVDWDNNPGLMDAGYCPDSLRVDAPLAEANDLNPMFGTYGSDTQYLDAVEEFPSVPAVSPDDVRLKVA